MKADSPLLEAHDLRLSYDGNPVLDGVNLAVARGEAVAIIGKSGAGKSVLLKCLAGVLRPDAGSLRLDGQPLADSGPQARATLHRRCSYLFQGNALFDSLSAFANVALPLEQTTDLPDHEIKRRTEDAMARLDLAGCARLFPSQLSGGQQKRLALARALVTQPDFVLFDEPTAGLDPLRRNAVFMMIATARREFGFTAIVVTHDVPEAEVVCDRLVLLDGGRIRFDGDAAQFAVSHDPVVHAFRDGTEALARGIDALGDPTQDYHENLSR